MGKALERRGIDLYDLSLILVTIEPSGWKAMGPKIWFMIMIYKYLFAIFGTSIKIIFTCF